MSFEDAKKINALIGAQTGTTSYYFLEKESSIKTKGYQMYGHAISDLINGKLDAVLGESSGTLFYKNKPLFKEIKMHDNELHPEALEIIRPYNLEKISVLSRVDELLNKFRLYT